MTDLILFKSINKVINNQFKKFLFLKKLLEILHTYILVYEIENDMIGNFYSV